jgi:toxin ParE1/3/4
MKIVWSRRAIRHLEQLRDYVAKDNPKAASHLALQIVEAVNLLSVQPNMGRPGRILGTRELVVPQTPYVIPYRVRGQQIELIAVFHSRQRWPRLL